MLCGNGGNGEVSEFLNNLENSLHTVRLLSQDFFFFFFCPFAFSRAAPAAYGGSQARGRIGAVAAGLRHSHSHARSKLRLQPTPHLTATPNPSHT